jgi:hypothetical protein
MLKPESVSIGRKQQLKSEVKTGSPVTYTLVLLLLLALAAFSIAAAPLEAFPEIIPLPDGFRPEGIAVGRGYTFYTGSLANGAIYSGDLRTGQGDVLIAGQEGRVAVGLEVDERTNYLYVAGGVTGAGYVNDADTGDLVASFQLSPTSPTFVNDVFVTREAAYFTDSMRPVLYRLLLDAGGRLSNPIIIEEIPLSGDFQFNAGAFNANGMAATPNGEWLILVHTQLGLLYRVDPATGVAVEIDLNGGAVPSGDGILLHGHTLYVVQNFLNQISVVELAPDLASGEIVQTITNPGFSIPTSIAEFGSALYVVNARFNVPPTPDTEYWAVRVEKH